MPKLDIIGSWTLIRHGIVSPDGNFTPTGSEMDGQLMYTNDGTMSVFITKTSTPSTLTDIIAYSGTFTITDSHVIHHLRVTIQKERKGSNEIRIASREGSVLTLKTEPTAQGYYEIVWQLIEH